MMYFRLPLLIVLLLVLNACTSTSSTKQGRGHPDHIQQTEIARAGISSNAYDVVRRLRPQWLSRRGRASLTMEEDVIVYVNAVRVGGTSALRDLSIDIVASMEYLSAGEATSRFGGGHRHGAILVTTRGG